LKGKNFPGSVFGGQNDHLNLCPFCCHQKIFFWLEIWYYLFESRPWP